MRTRTSNCTHTVATEEAMKDLAHLGEPLPLPDSGEVGRQSRVARVPGATRGPTGPNGERFFLYEALPAAILGPDAIVEARTLSATGVTS